MRLLLLVLSLLVPASAMAQGWIEPRPLPRPLPHPPLVEKLRTSVTVRIVDRVARVEVEEWFRNAGGGLAEGDYLYPLPGEAVFSEFSLFQGEEELKGESMDATRARAIYEEIVRRHRDPALIELAGHGLLRARVFPIGPGETRNVKLRYTQVLDRTGDALRFRYLAGAQRPRSGGPVPRQSGEAQENAPLTFTLTSDEAGRFGEPFSPTHRLQVTRDRNRLSVRPSQDLSGTFDVFLPLSGPRVGISLATHRVDGEDGYFMLTLSPGAVQAAASTPRDVAVVVDVSGSMSGEKMEQARDALHQLLGTLNPNDRFRLISFGNRVDAQRPDWAPATRVVIDEARRWVDRLAAAGGTNISGALDEALRTPAGPERLHMVIFITDGLPTVGESDPERLAARVEAALGNARVFTFGVGYDLNTYLLERIAVAGRGTVDYVEPGRSVEEAVGALATRIRHPVLVDLAFSGSPVRLDDMQPTRLPDLYAGQELLVFGRYRTNGRDAAGELSITGTRNGRTERFASRVEFPAHDSSSAYIPSLWAARKVGDLMRTIRIEGSTPERVAQVRELALRHGLITEYTSYLVQEPMTRAAVVPVRTGQAQSGGRGGSGAGVGAGAPVPFAAPVAVATPPPTGQVAVESARVDAMRLQTSSLADLAAAGDAVAGGRVLIDGAATHANTRLVSGRTFRLVSGVWVDAAHQASAETLHVEPFSRAYFDILAKLPELAPYWKAFDAVTVAGARTSIRVAAGGRASLPAGELDALVRAFRAP
jgi:Ca-activated chloride channel homolog